MTTLLKPAAEKIMRFFYENKSLNNESQIHLRELSRKTGLVGQSIVRSVKFLEKYKLVQSKKQGNQKIISTKNNKQVFAIFTFFDVERFEKLPEIRRQAINTFLSSLSKQPVFVVLFGSIAKGTFKEGSDIDLLLITNEKIETKDAEKEADALHAQKISVFQMSYKQFKTELKLKEDNVVQSALGTGYPLVNHVLFYEMLLNEKS